MRMAAAGREQAAITGERLRQANISYNEIIHSTLDRAVQTAQIIHSYLPRVPLHADEMLVEGGPIPPVPTITYWHLPQKVSNSSSSLRLSPSIGSVHSPPFLRSFRPGMQWCGDAGTSCVVGGGAASSTCSRKRVHRQRTHKHACFH